MFRAFGHTNSGVLDSGLPAWESTLNVEESSHVPSTASQPGISSPPPMGASYGLFRVVSGLYVRCNNSGSRPRANGVERSKFDLTSEPVLDARPRGR